MRLEFTAKTKVKAFERSKGRCEKCTARLSTGNIEYDHEIPCALGGDNSLENCVVLCRSCHSTKTRTADVPRIAKANRNYRKARGIRKPSQFSCSRGSKWKKKIDGTVVAR